MPSVRPRISIDADLWKAVEAVAKANGIQASAFIERALTAYLDPLEELRNASSIVREASLNVREVNDQIAVIADFIVDKYHSERRS